MLSNNSAVTLEQRQADLEILRRKKQSILVDFKKDKIGSSIAERMVINVVMPLNEVIAEWFESGSMIFLNSVSLDSLLKDYQPKQNKKAFLENLWRNHLLQSIDSEVKKKAYIDMLFKHAHSTGLHDALNRAHNQRLQELGYTANSEELEHPVIFSYAVVDNVLQFTDISAITKVTPDADDEKTSPVIDYNNDNKPLILYEMETRFEFPLSAENAVQMNVVFQQDKIYNEKVFEFLLFAAAQLVVYAFKYIENKGHVKAFSEWLLAREEYADIDKYTTVKNNNYHSLIPGKAEWHHQADKIFSYTAVNFPSFVEKLLAEYELAQENEEEFVYYLKLLHRLSDIDKPSLVNKALAKYSQHIPAHEDKLFVTAYTEAEYRRIYHLCKARHYFRISMTATDVTTNAAKAIDEYIDEKVSKLQETPQRNWVNTSFWGYAESRGICRAHAYSLLLQQAETDMAKCAIVICILKDTSSKILRQKVLEGVRPHTEETLHDFFSWMPDNSNQFNPKFHAQFIDPIIAATNKIKNYDQASLPVELNNLINELNNYFSNGLNFLVTM